MEWPILFCEICCEKPVAVYASADGGWSLTLCEDCDRIAEVQLPHLVRIPIEHAEPAADVAPIALDILPPVPVVNE